MMDDLPDKYDLIVVGTGFTESCVAAAASRIGKTVLHMDINDYYGSTWASFNIEKFNELLDGHSPTTGVANTSWEWHDDRDEDNDVANLSADVFLEESTHFSIDLVPRVAYANGELVKLLISSNISRYAEFRLVDHVCILFNKQLLCMPCSRSDVFNTRDLEIVEKHLLMKLLKTCMEMDETHLAELAEGEFKDSTFAEYLESQRLTDKIRYGVRQAIAMCNDKADFKYGLKRTQLFLHSLGIYGNSPFLYPQYGCGELPQCFCRLSAVFGAIYYLNHTVNELEIEEENIGLRLDTGQKINAKHLVLTANCLPETMLADTQVTNTLSRAVFLSKEPLGGEDLNCGTGGVNIIRLVTEDDTREAIVMHQTDLTRTCPKGLYVMHFTTKAMSNDPKEDLKPFLDQIFNDELKYSPKVLYSAYFTITERKPNTNLNGVYFTDGPKYEVDYELALENARNIFHSLYGEQVPFLPRAPDPEEIIIEGENPCTLHAHELPEDLRKELVEFERMTNELALAGNTNYIDSD